MKLKHYILISSLTFLAALGACAYFKVFVINDTPSMPEGLYVKDFGISKIKIGDIVSACLSEHISTLAEHAGYIDKTHTCPGGGQVLVKKVIAIPGDTVQVTSQFLIVNHKRYIAPRFVYNPEGKKIVSIISPGIYHTHKYWLYGAADSIYSWDSRYFGGVVKNAITGILKPLVTF